MSRFLTGHQVNPSNDVLTIEVLDEPGSGGAHHAYDITGFDTSNNPASCDTQGYRRNFSRTPIVFQNGPIAEAGVNGLTHEALLAILIDRLECFQTGPYACPENARALAHFREARIWLNMRTTRRISSGIEGTHALDGDEVSRDITEKARTESP